MLQRKSSPLRASALALMISVALFGVAPHRATAQAVQPAMPTPIPEPEAPTPPAPPPPSFALMTAIPAVPPALPAPSPPDGKGIWPHGDSDRVRVPINGSILNTVGGTENPRASKSRRREQQALGSKRQEPGRRQWIMGERLRVANEATRREADRMINAASPMDWRNRYGSD